MANYTFYLYLLGFSGAIYVLYETVRRYKSAGWILFCILPIVLLPLIVANISSTPDAKTILFLIAKFYSVIAAACLTQICGFTKFGKKKWLYKLIYFLVLLNIFEACLVDLTHGLILNGLAGLLLAATLPTFNQSRIIRSGKTIDFSWNIPKLWIVGYTIWNLLFVYTSFPTMISMHVIILGIALLVGLWRNELWLQARGFTLGVYLCIKYISPQLFSQTLIYNLPSNDLYAILGLLSLAYMFCFVLIPRAFSLYNYYLNKAARSFT